MKLKLITAVTGLLLSSLTLAESYRADIGLAATRYDDNLYNSDTKDYNLLGAYYFKAVQTDNRPLAEAAFLGQSSNIFADVYDRPGQHGVPHLNSFSVGTEIYIPENFLYVQAGVVRRSSNYSDRDDWFTTVGITPIDGLLLTTSYSNDAGYDANLEAKYVTDIGGGQFINLQAAVVDLDDGTLVSAGGDYYFDRTFSVGGMITDYDGSTDYTLRTRKFFSENFSGDLAYTDTDGGNEVTLGVNFRF